MSKHLLKSLCSGLILASTLAGASAWADTRHLLIGGYNDAIVDMKFDTTTGQLNPNSSVLTPATNASWLVFDAKRSLVFAVNENSSAAPPLVGKAQSFQLRAEGQPMQALSIQDTRGNEPTHASLTPDGRFLLVANYAVMPGTGGSLAVLPVSAQGKLDPVVQQLVHEPSKVNPARQASSHIHQSYIAPDGKQVFVMDLGGDKVYSYLYDASDAKSPLHPADPPFYSLPPGSGPRHMAITQDGKHAYLTLEMAGKVVVFSRDNGKLQQQAMLDLTPPNFTGTPGGGAIELSPDNKFLYVTDRGTDNRILVFAVAADGQLTPVQQRSSEGQEPRVFQFSPDGRYLLITNQFSNEIVILQRDPQKGTLGDVVQRIPFVQPSMLVFLPEKP